ncbi:MAG: S8 family serine peptidase [Bacteroidetes bacterium]|nr:S8 family serine peptidase [Bacteroidota bacterium]
MKKLLFLFIALPAFIFSQLNTNSYQSKRLWVKLKNPSLSITSVSGVSQEATIPDVFTNFGKSVRINKVSKSFTNISNFPALQNIYEVDLASVNDVGRAIKVLKSSPEVEYAESIPLEKLSYNPNDPNYSAQWELAKINASGAWNLNKGSTSVVVAVIDDAIQINHADLASSIWVNSLDNNTNGVDNDNNGYIDDKNGFDVADNDNDPSPTSAQFFHGTQVAGAAAATTDNAKGVASIGFKIKIMPIKASNVANAITHGYEGILYAAINKANVICLAWGSPVATVTGQSIIDFAYSKGCVIVAAAGNDNTNAMYYPAAYNNVIAVASTNNGDVKSSFSNFGNWIDVSAPGDNIFTTTYTMVANSGYSTASGTSISAGIVSGLCGLMLSYKPAVTQQDIENCLKNNADQSIYSLAGNTAYAGLLGSGRIESSSALSCLLGTQYNTPIADFEANYTTIYAGSKISFTNKSKHAPTSYQWRVDTGAANLVSPQTNLSNITFKTPGVYTVTLSATNSFGTDVEVKTNYITVLSGPKGCDTLYWENNPFSNNPNPNKWSASLWTYPDAAASGGHAFGVNSLLHKEIAQLYGVSNGLNYVHRITLLLGKTSAPASSIASKYIKIKVYGLDSITRKPVDINAPVTNVPLSTLLNASPSGIKTVIINLPAIKIPSVGIAGVKPDSFFVSIAMQGGGLNEGNLQWAASNGDTMALIGSSFAPVQNPNEDLIWYKKADNSWCHLKASGGCTPWDFISKSHIHMFPHMTDLAPEVQFTTSSDTICENDFIVFDATNSKFNTSLGWDFGGGKPNVSSRIVDTIYFTNSGSTPKTYNVKLVGVSSGCANLTDTLIKTIVVNPKPQINVSLSPGNSICIGSGDTLTAVASGASSYSWSPSSGLSATIGDTVKIVPLLNNQTYEVAATTANGCYGATSFNVYLDTMPVANGNVSVTNTIPNQFINLDATTSSNVATFVWSMPGATPASSTSPLATIKYTSAGTYTVNLKVTNSCGSDSSFSQIITITPNTGIGEWFTTKHITSMYSADDKSVFVSVNNLASMENATLVLTNQLGQQNYVQAIDIQNGQNSYAVPASTLSKGIYYLTIGNVKGMYVNKIVVQ